MKKCFLSLLLLLMFVPSFGAKPRVKASHARYWTWVNYSSTRDWDAYFTTLKDVGIEGILISSGRDGLEKIIPVADKYGIEVHAWLWVMNNGGIAAEHPEWLDYNALGESLADVKAYVDYYKFLNPAIPGVRKAIATNFENIATTPGLGGVSLDYCRYVDAILPHNLWKSYGITQDRIHPQWDYGFHPVMVEAFMKKHGYDPRKLEDPVADKKWLDFRCNVLNKFVDSLAVVIHGGGVSLSASPFPTPSMSKEMVRQDWSNWPLEMAFPMIYHGFYKEGSLEWIGQCVRECRRTMRGSAKLFYGMHIPDFGNPNGPSLTQAIEMAVANGAEGFSMYTFDALNEKQRAELKQVIQKLNAKK